MQECIQMAHGSAQPQEVSNTHRNTMFFCETQNDLQHVVGVIRQMPEREKNTEDTAHCGLPFSFNSFDPSKDFYKVCYVNAIYSPPPQKKTIIPFMNTAARC